MLQLTTRVARWRSGSQLFARTLTSLSALTLLGACGKPLADAECVDLLDHYVELLLKSDNPDTTAEERLHLRQEARSKARRDPAFSECSSRVSRRQFDCAMQAQSPDRLEQCLL